MNRPSVVDAWADISVGRAVSAEGPRAELSDGRQGELSCSTLCYEPLSSFGHRTEPGAEHRGPRLLLPTLS